MVAPTTSSVKAADFDLVRRVVPVALFSSFSFVTARLVDAARAWVVMLAFLFGAIERVETGARFKKGDCLDLLEAFWFEDVLKIMLWYAAEGQELWLWSAKTRYKGVKDRV